MSPLLFNQALDPLIQKLEREGRGFAIDGRPLTSMAFADDLVMVSDSWDGMALNIVILETFCQLTGMSVQPSKCHGFFLDTQGKTLRVNNCSAWNVDGKPIHMIPVDESVKYLGVSVNPVVGLSPGNMPAKVQQWIGAIRKTPLDPVDKVSLLRDYAIPQVTFVADHCMLSTAVLTEMDGYVKQAVKSWLHLPTCTAD
ncbi:hypothetical protein VZT92_005798 [Zoarces viviparus]|uniref:Reverse transcriptase domain-containing protein n=2 Tax=Zoarces viviparus TaxID=48416 RepID=A0AAW1FNH9_ZOAVI